MGGREEGMANFALEGKRGLARRRKWRGLGREEYLSYWSNTILFLEDLTPWPE